MSIQNGTTLTHEALSYLCGLIRDINGLDTNLIDDINIKSNGTFSSLRINTLLNALKTDCNDYTDSLVSNISRLELKIVTDESSIVDSNILYLHKPTGQTSYNQYVVIEGNKVLLGTTDINMTDYYTITQADNKFVLKTDFDALKTTVNNIKTDIGTEDISSVGTSVKDAINELNTNKEEKSNKVTTIDSTSTDTQYPSAKAVKTELDKKIDKSSIVTTIGYSSTDNQVPSAKSIYYNCIEGIELTQRIIDTYGTEILKYPLGIWRIHGDNVTSKFADLPVKKSGRIEITSIDAIANKNPWDNTWGYRVYNFETYNEENYIRKITSGYTAGALSDTGWKKVCTTSVEDTSLKTLTTSSDINSDADITYIVKNGICTVSANTISSSKMASGNITLTTGLPIPINPSCWYSLCTNSNATNAPVQNLLVRIDDSGNLISYIGTNNSNYFGTFSYPVKAN